MCAAEHGIYNGVLIFDGRLFRVVTLAEELGLTRAIQEIRRESDFEYAVKTWPRTDAHLWLSRAVLRSCGVTIEKVHARGGDGGCAP